MAAETSPGHCHVVRAIKEDGWVDGGTARRDVARLGTHPANTHAHTHTRAFALLTLKVPKWA